MKSKLLPEALYEEENISLEDASSYLKTKTSVTGTVLDVRKDHEEVIVSLGSGLFGILPYDEFTIYPFTYKHGGPVPDQIKYLLNQKIRVKITDIIEDNIILSRKKNMECALEHLKNCSYAQFLVTNNIASKLFGDIGDGITGAVSSKELSRCRIRNVTEVLHQGDLEWMKILDYDVENKFYMSYREMFEPYNPDKFKPNDGLWVTVNEPVDTRHSGYYVSISPQVNGIMDIGHNAPVLRYGDKVFARVKSSNATGVKLYFVAKAD